MDQFSHTVWALKIERTVKALEKNGMKATYFKDKSDLYAYLNQAIRSIETVSVGGSMTLFELGLIDWLRTQPVTFLDRYQEGLTPEAIKDLYRQSFSVQCYLTSTNAVTEEGALFNVDGRGNRVAAMVYGPDQVWVICGTNKIVKNDFEAIERNRRQAAPANAMRLSRKTPCATTGLCSDCQSEERICSHYVFMKKQMVKDRIHVLLVEGEWGY